MPSAPVRAIAPFIPARTIAGGLISWAARQHGDRPSLICQGRTYSHAEVESRSNRFAQALIALGLGPGERLAVLLENSVESVDSVFGGEKAAVTYVALNARHAIAEHLDILDDAGASAVLVGPQFGELAQALVADRGRRLPGLRRVLAYGLQDMQGLIDMEAACAAAPDAPPAIEVGADHILRIAYSSGTTGKPKGVARTVELMLTRLNNHFMAMEHGLSIDDAMLYVAPMTHAAGVYLLPCFLRGARNIVHERFDASAVLAAIERERITQLLLVPTMMSRLVSAIEGGAKADVSSLRRIHYGTAPTPVDLIRRALRIFGPILRQQYGMSEAVQPLAVLYPHEHSGDSADPADDPIGSVGRPTCNVRITLRGADGREVPQGDVGEIAIASEGIGKVLYWRRPELAAQTVRDGWFHTGDLGRFDRGGYLHIVGRSKDMIITGGFNVYAREVEDALTSHPAVLEAAVLGLPDPEWGEIVAAAVVLEDGAKATADEMVAHCAQRVAGYKKPRRILLIEALPRNHAGKVMKAQLRLAFAASPD